MKRTRPLAAVLTAATLAAVLVPSIAGQAATATRTYRPPFRAGAKGGDFSNLIYSDPSTGRVGVLRAYPVPGPFGCSSTGGFVTLRVLHHVTSAVRSVTVLYSGAAVDPYSFLIVEAKDGNRYMGSKEVRGPVTGSGQVRVPLDLGTPQVGSVLRIDFGVEVSSACPNADGATAQFDSVRVRGG